jgi:hypothetical protein
MAARRRFAMAGRLIVLMFLFQHFLRRNLYSEEMK